MTEGGHPEDGKHKMNRSESKYFHTAQLMDEALVSLLAEKDFAYLTVKELCARAGVNRTTFYLHYETMGDLLAEALDVTMKRFLDAFPVEATAFVPSIREAPLDDLLLINEQYLIPYLTFIRDNRKIYLAAFQNPKAMEADRQMEDVSRYVLMPILERFGVPAVEREYWIAYYVHGCMAIVREWISRDCMDTIEAVARIMMACIQPHGAKVE